MFSLIIKEPRIPKTLMARACKVNPNTIHLWWDAAIRKRIIILPIFRRKSYSNFAEHFYFFNTEDPHELYEQLQQTDLPLIYFAVHTGICNFQIISKEPINLSDIDLIYYGVRSDYFVSIPPNIPLETSIKRVDNILGNLDRIELRESPLQFRDYAYEPWDEKDEAIYWNICNDLRKPFASVIKSTRTYNDKAWDWFKSRHKFGDTITFFYPNGEGAYAPSMYFIDTDYDSIIIDLFSQLPTSVLFYRMCDKVVLTTYLPFTLEGRSIVRRALSILKKEKLVNGYTNSVVDYYYRF